MPEFTQDWFSHNIPGLERMMALLPQKQLFLEIGAFEGRSTLWFCEQLDKSDSYNPDSPDSYIDVIDTWRGSEEHNGIDFDAVKSRFDANVEDKNEILAFRGNLFQFLADGRADAYDFIYIDGSHQAPHVLQDACLAWPMLKKGGIMVFDDYLWGVNEPPTHTPKMAVDAFIACYREQLEIVMAGYQMGIKKL
jgi:predicted O-methyltransferase YrrM